MRKLIKPDSEPQSANPLEARYESLRARGKEATRHGEFGEALAAYETARAVAVELGDPAKIDASDLNRSMVLVQMGEARQGEEGLREILLRTSDRRVAFTAAYNLASSLRKQGRYERATRYAYRAMDQARQLGSADYVAGVHNLLGNIQLNQSYLDEALTEYQAALTLRLDQPGDTRYSQAILEENIGYCLLLKHRFDEGLEHIRRALRLSIEVDDQRCRAECLQDLCYGHLLQDEYAEAAEYGEAALRAAIEGSYEDIEENSHYLLGELGSRVGDISRRDEHFERLQAMHPELPFLKDFLCSVDVTSIITLKR